MAFGDIVQRRTPTLFAGRLRHKIDLVRVSSSQDSTGGVNPAVSTVYANVWATVQDYVGRQQFAAQEFVSEVTHQVVIRWIGAAPSWAADTNYGCKALVLDPAGYLQQAQGGGTSGSEAPTWNETPGGFTQDGDTSTGIIWLNVGLATPRTGVTSALQVWFNGRTFQILYVTNPDERNKLLILICKELNSSVQQVSNQPGGLN